jgi:putative ABC transport system substrate-binding protein
VIVRRREFIRIFGGLAFVPPAIGQTASVPLVGFLNAASPDTYRFNADSFRKGLRQAGFIEGQNVRIEERWANGDYQALPRLAADLVAKGVVAIAATGDVASAQAAKDASSSVPVVFTIGADPVRFGLVESLNHPGGHVTGIHLLSSLLGAKRVELLHQFSPKIRRIALLMNPDNRAAAAEQADAEAGARVLGVETVAFDARNAREIGSVFSEILRAKADSLFGATDPIMLDQREQIVSFANREALPAVYFVRQFAAIGGLLSYGPSITWMYEQAGRYIGRILKGDKPANMPVLQPTGFEFVVNLKTAQALGLDVPPTLLARADEVIE